MKSYRRKIGSGLLLLLICCTKFTYSYAQNCSKINTWVDKAASYTEGIHLNLLDAYGIMKLTAPAFHDDHFKPVFGKNYAALSDADKERIKSKLLECVKEQPIVAKGLITGFENGNMTYSWDRQVKAINNSSAAENERIAQYDKQSRDRNRMKQQRVAQQRKVYDQRRGAATRTRTRRSTTPVQQNPNAYNTAPKDRVNTAENYRREATEMKTFLAAIKGISAPSHAFQGYKNGSLMEKVYRGNFEGFPVGLKDMQEENVMGGLSKVNTLKKYQRYLLIYLEYFSTHCASKTPSNYKRVKIRYEVIKTEHNVPSTEGFTEPEIYFMKSYFENDFRRMHKALSNAAPIEAMWILASGEETGLNFEQDLKILFSKQQCEAPMIRQFETNLYLASKGKSSLQKLLPYID